MQKQNVVSKSRSKYAHKCDEKRDIVKLSKYSLSSPSCIEYFAVYVDFGCVREVRLLIAPDVIDMTNVGQGNDVLIA